MKFAAALTLALPLASAFPSRNMRSVEIRDPSEIERLTKLNQEVQGHLLKGDVTHVSGRDVAPGENHHEKRIFQIFGLAGMALVETGGALAGIAGGLANRLQGIFTGDNQEQIWHNHASATWRHMTRALPIQRPLTTGVVLMGKCAWVNPESTGPGLKFFEGDQGIGKFSIQYTATDKVAWSGTPDTKKCPFEGLCNPQLMFYRDGYAVVLNTWLSQGEISACQYSNGEDCKGLCNSGVKDQFSPNGMKWGGDCAIPCIGDTDLPDSK
ncbi:Fibronectin type III domain [Fusarium albosuccineum]|uniref:Fibronectin type III domain n=1 Tax=Fusarium albosuccineum TaxID=1237068 RepID=A0A8H4LN72_9HYPO|nr:Fibronectin type III domain [Fusarium albosuccineum]